MVKATNPPTTTMMNPATSTPTVATVVDLRLHDGIAVFDFVALDRRFRHTRFDQCGDGRFG